MSAREPKQRMTVHAARVRLAQYAERTSTWSTATYNDGTEKALHEIALTLLAEVDRLEAERHSTNEALDNAVQELRARSAEAVLDDFIARCEVALSGCCSECDAAIAIVKGRRQAALDGAPVPELPGLLSGDALRAALACHLFGGGAL
ncbi:hypothetical protein [Streptomyces sp. NPDC101249]|uniref:hypothetical protein n=1 Tax=Streptomyces sp. NPDC101249 TaxID=3366140 RepID=UPI0037F93F25